ncbi:MAG: hypothetical protein FD150_843 [Rhodobacteraceae bacterium]|nr:MAG: hypothetical protein FD150_843 [Paracoccaceae bacterium]
MNDVKVARWARILLGLLTLVVLGFTLSAYPKPTMNPGLAALTGEVAGLGSVAGGFLGRQLGLALIAAAGAALGSRLAMLFGSFALLFFNLHDAVLMSLAGAGGIGAISGLILAVLAGVVFFKSFSTRAA